MAKPLIGITCGIRQSSKKEAFYGVLPAYTRSVAMAGGLPILITPDLDQVSLREIYDRVDGVLFSGGGDVDADRYGMANDDLVQSIQSDRDATEIELARWAAAENKSVFGICRGVQVVNVALGGTLYRDIATEYPGYTGQQHDMWEKAPRGFEAHPVQIEDGTQLAAILGTQTVKVNTLHHQALREVAPNLRVSAYADDGLIEGVELPHARFFVGVQWHPEEMTEYSETMRRLFSAFVAAAHR
ncbi:MAG: gamma-glutamyl-gamma-aminobutyrate hydrolase family protein [Chloroflexota bacterium]